MNMIKIPALLSLLLFSYLINAQGKLEIGIETGPNISKIYGNSFIKNYHNSRIGFYSGIGLQYNFSKNIALRTGLGFERKGTAHKSDITDNMANKIGQIKYHSNLDYVTLPILFRYSFGMKTKLFVNLGPNFGILIHQKEVSDARPEFSKSVYSNYDSFKKLNIGLSTGVGASHPISDRLKLNIEVRNNLGLSPINDYLPISNQDIKTNALNFLLGISMQLDSRYSNTTTGTPRF